MIHLFHKWSQWSDPKTATTAGGINYRYQCRHCLVCNKVEEQRV